MFIICKRSLEQKVVDAPDAMDANDTTDISETIDAADKGLAKYSIKDTYLMEVTLRFILFSIVQRLKQFRAFEQYNLGLYL